MPQRILRFVFIIISLSLHLATHSTAATPDDEETIAKITEITPQSAGLGDEIKLMVADAPQLNDGKFSTKKVTLLIDGIPLIGVFPRMNNVDDSGNGIIRFYIPHDEGTSQLWGALLQSTPEDRDGFKRKVSINLGLYQEETKKLSIVTNEKDFSIILVREKWLWTVIGLLVILTLIFFGLAVKSDIVRDTCYSPPPGKRRPYSLAKSQMAIWTFVIISAWLYLYVFQHTLNTVSDSMAVLMGISSATSLGAVTLQKNTAREDSTQGFLIDILSDSSGVSFQRFQIFAWTIVMVVVFCRQVIFYYEMPEFDASILVMLGISSGSYLGYKATEEKPKEVKPSSKKDPDQEKQQESKSAPMK